MNNVNDLNRTSNLTNGKPTQEVSFSAINPRENNSVSINATNGLSGVSQENINRPTIHINPTKKVNRNLHRTVEAGNEEPEVNPNDYIQRPAPAPTMSPRDMALSELDKTVRRKQDEYRQFVQYAKEQDEENRERVEAGLESVGEEVQYLPDNIHVPMKEEEKVASNTTSNSYSRNNATADEDDILGDEDPDNFQETGNVILSDPFEREYTQQFTPDYPYSEQVEEAEAVEEEPTEEEDYVKPPIEEENYSEEKTMEPNEGETYKEEVQKENTEQKMDKFFTNSSMNVTSTISESTSSDDFASIEDEDFEDVTTSSEENLTDDQIKQAYNAGTENLKNEILEKIINVGRKMNASQFVVSNKVVSVKDALKYTNETKQRTARWPLTYAGRPYVASALKGPEISLLADYDDTDNGVSLTREQARIMFEHDANPYRPATVEAWAKTIPYYDVENIFAAMFVASLKGANYMPMICDKKACQHAYLSDNIDIMDMIKFEKDDSKKRFDEISKMELTPELTTKYDTVVSVINDRFAVGIKIPSIFTMIYERATLNQEFIRKHESVIGLMEYIDYIYMIDPETNQLNPVGWKTYPGDYTKNYKSKIATYAKILKQFDGTDFSILIAMINAMIGKIMDMNTISYEIPAGKCTKCGAEIPAQALTPRSMLFTQQRLVTLATTHTER